MTDANHPSVGDYVLATKYDDGDPMDHWCVGFYAGRTDHTPQRHHVTDKNGNLFRGNGFRRVKTITPERGEWMVKHAEIIMLSGKSVWHFAGCTMESPSTKHSLTINHATENSPKWSDQRVAQKLMSFARNIHALRMKQDRESKRPTK